MALPFAMVTYRSESIESIKYSSASVVAISKLEVLYVLRGVFIPERYRMNSVPAAISVV